MDQCWHRYLTSILKCARRPLTVSVLWGSVVDPHTLKLVLVSDNLTFSHPFVITVKPSSGFCAYWFVCDVGWGCKKYFFVTTIGCNATSNIENSRLQVMLNFQRTFLRC